MEEESIRADDIQYGRVVESLTMRGYGASPDFGVNLVGRPASKYTFEMEASAAPAPTVGGISRVLGVELRKT